MATDLAATIQTSASVFILELILYDGERLISSVSKPRLSRKEVSPTLISAKTQDTYENDQ